MALLSTIQCCHFLEEMAIREIDRRAELSGNTIRKYLRAVTVEPKFKVPDRPSKLDSVIEKVTGWFKGGTSKLCKQRRMARQMQTDLVDLGYGGLHRCVAAFRAGLEGRAAKQGPDQRARDLRQHEDGRRSDRLPKDLSGRRSFCRKCEHCLFECELCDPSSGSQKGQLEKTVHGARRRLWQPVPRSG